MCGIAGFFDRNVPAEYDRIAINMALQLSHRGPDDSGTWVDADAGVALGFRRLAIVELSPAGHQPMISKSGRYVIVFNGEIYNHQWLRSELEANGVQGWRGHSDTETLLEALSHWGLDRTLELCSGMFAFGVWDRSLRRLTLARDRMG